MGTGRAIVWKLEATPSWLTERLDRLFDGGEPVALCFESDMTLEGNYGPEAVVVTDRRVLAIAPDRDAPLREVPLGEVALVKVKQLMGNVFLLVTTWNENVEMLRVSSSLADVAEEFKNEFDEHLMSRLEWDRPDEHEDKVEHRDDEEPTAEASERARRCPQCGQLLPRDRDICRACLSARAVMFRMLSYLKPYAKTVALGLGISLLMAGIMCALPVLSRTLINDAIGKGDLGLLKWLVVTLAVLLAVRSVGMAAQRLVMARLSQNIIYDLRHEVYAHLQKLSMEFHDRQSTGRLISRVVSDTAQLQEFAVGTAQQFIVDLLMMFIVLAWMFTFSAKLTLMLWFPLPLFFVLVRWYQNNVHKVFRKAFRLRAAMSGHLADTIPGIETVKAFGQERRSIEEFNGHSGGYRGEVLKANDVGARFLLGWMVMTQLGTVLVYWFGGQDVIGGTVFTTGDLVMFLGWIAMMYAPIWRFATLTEQFENASTSAERVFDVLDNEVVVGENQTGHEIKAIEQGIRFENVSFHYDAGPPVLKNVSFEARAGETIGIVGPSGSGKTTLIRLLCRFYDPTEGRILIDGQDLAGAQLRSFRGLLAVVAQNPVLFQETLLENIRYGRPEASCEAVIRAATTANAHDFIMQFPEAYDTDAREHGSRLSGGERQRICIARAVLKDPQLLILDEATSAVDTRNEKLIQSALDRLVKDRTTFIIAHRLSTLRNANRIIMMQDGRVLDIAPHDVLMERCRPYRELVEAQTELGAEPMLEVA